jgi:hypothetical protein
MPHDSKSITRSSHLLISSSAPGSTSAEPTHSQRAHPPGHFPCVLSAAEPAQPAASEAQHQITMRNNNGTKHCLQGAVLERIKGQRWFSNSWPPCGGAPQSCSCCRGRIQPSPRSRSPSGRHFQGATAPAAHAVIGGSPTNASIFLCTCSMLVTKSAFPKARSDAGKRGIAPCIPDGRSRRSGRGCHCQRSVS